MPIFHVSISANDPQAVATFLAGIMGGEAMPFPPFPDCWIAFAQEDDGTAVEVYPTTHVLTAGSEQIACEVGEPNSSPTFVHIALGSVLAPDEILRAAEANGWKARTCDRGPFQCVEVWLENRLLVELLDARMQTDYRNGMTASNWASMFGLEGKAGR
jgi:hypothetical protein